MIHTSSEWSSHSGQGLRAARGGKWTMKVDHQTGPSCETISADQMATLSADHENSIEPPDVSYSSISDNCMLLTTGYVQISVKLTRILKLIKGRPLAGFVPAYLIIIGRLNQVSSWRRLLSWRSGVSSSVCASTRH